MTTAIEVRDLTKTYQVPVRAEGVLAALRALGQRQMRTVSAVRDVSFSIAPGTIVGFIGPNGAGKTTTLKMLCGVLHPTSGQAQVMGYVPWGRDPAFLRQIALLRGSRPLNAPLELTVMDVLLFQGVIYGVEEHALRHNLRELSALLDLEPLLGRQIRALSLGERARAGLAWSLIYRPRLLFLDEPTLGLDVTAITTFRGFIQAYVRQTGATALLTSHYMADVASLCPRVLLIHHGALLFDGPLADLAAAQTPERIITFTFAAPAPSWARLIPEGRVLGSTPQSARVGVPRDQVPAVIARMLDHLPVLDIAIDDPPLEEIIDRIYRAEAK